MLMYQMLENYLILTDEKKDLLMFDVREALIDWWIPTWGPSQISKEVNWESILLFMQWMVKPYKWSNDDLEGMKKRVREIQNEYLATVSKS